MQSNIALSIGFYLWVSRSSALGSVIYDGSKDRFNRLGNRHEGVARGAAHSTTEARNDVFCGGLAGLSFSLKALVVTLSGGLGLGENALHVAEHVSGVGLEGLCRQSDTAIGLVVIKDHNLASLANGEQRFNIINAVVRNLRNVKKTSHSAIKLKEGSIVAEAGDCSTYDGASTKVSGLVIHYSTFLAYDQFTIVFVDVQKFYLVFKRKGVTTSW
jgi:hypothetical protein